VNLIFMQQECCDAALIFSHARDDSRTQTKPATMLLRQTSDAKPSSCCGSAFSLDCFDLLDDGRLPICSAMCLEVAQYEGGELTYTSQLDASGRPIRASYTVVDECDCGARFGSTVKVDIAYRL